MELPLQTQQLIKQSLKTMRQNPMHHLKPTDRPAIYKSFDPARFDLPEYTKHGTAFDDDEFREFFSHQFLRCNQGDHAIGWLAILTVKQVLQEWELKNLTEWESQYISTIQEILQVAQAVLTKKIEFIQAHDNLINDFWYFTHFFVNYEISCLKNAAILALETIIYMKNLNGFPLDDQVEELSDFVGEALKAYTATDENPPGAVDMEEIIIPIEFDARKRLEFWEWWLTEAIPEAWKLAAQSSKH